MPRSASELFRIISTSFGIRIITNVIGIIYASFGIRILFRIIYASFGVRIITLTQLELFMPCSASELTYYFDEIAIVYCSFGVCIVTNEINYASSGIQINKI